MTKKRNTQKNADSKAEKPPIMVPNPIMVFLVVVSCIVLMSILFAGIKVFLVQDALLGNENIIQENGSINVTFCRQSNCEDILLYELNKSKTIECAFYDLDLPRTTELLKQKNANLLIYEDKAYNESIVAGMTTQNTKHVISDGLMHDKFCVLDINTPQERIVTGSMNPTINDAQKNDNNLLVIKSRTLAQRYEKEYVELSSRTSKDYKKNSALPAFVNISGTIIEQHFCPQESCESAVILELQNANKTINFMTFSFTSDKIGDALVYANSRNVIVKGVFEKRQVDQWTELEKLKTEGMNVTVDGNSATMHHKVFIIDGKTVITGSFNPTANANTRNDENLLIIHDENIAMQYTNEFNRVYGMTK